MTRLIDHHPVRLRRSVLCVPADNVKALAKVAVLDCDAVIYDLEDAVAPEAKPAARQALSRHLAERRRDGRETIVRINALSSEFGEADLAMAVLSQPDAILLPKVDTPQDIRTAADWMAENDVADDVRLWAMIETTHGLLNVAAIAETGRTRGGRLDCLVPGLNDLRRETRVPAHPGRAFVMPWLMQMLLAARGSSLDIIDAVFNDIRDDQGFEAECRDGRAMGFDGKMLIHPAQIAPANRHFSASQSEMAEAREIIDAFALPENTGRGVIALSGRMVERLHLDQAIRLLERDRMNDQREKST